MRLIAFPQWDKLTSLLRGMARQSAADFAQRNIVRIIPKNGIAHLANYAANLLAVEGGTTTIIICRGQTPRSGCFWAGGETGAERQHASSGEEYA